MERSLKKKYWADQAKKSVLLIPALVLLLAFFIIPIVLTVYYSFTNMALTGAAAQNFQFIGLENYKRILSDPNTLVSIRNTFIFLIGSLVGQSVLGFLIAYFMKGKAKAFRSVVGPCILAGWVMPEIVVSLCCLAFFDVSGTFNKIIGTLHIPGVDFIYGHPMMTIIIANVWHGTAFSMLNFQSALDNVSGDIEEAARVDGANRIQTLVRIIVPCIKDTIATNTMVNYFRCIWSDLGADRRRSWHVYHNTSNLYVQSGTEELPVRTGNSSRYDPSVCRCCVQYYLYQIIKIR